MPIWKSAIRKENRSPKKIGFLGYSVNSKIPQKIVQMIDLQSALFWQKNLKDLKVRQIRLVGSFIEIKTKYEKPSLQHGLTVIRLSFLV